MVVTFVTVGCGGCMREADLGRERDFGLTVDVEEEEEFDDEVFVDAAMPGPLDCDRLIGGYFVELIVDGFLILVKGGCGAAPPDLEDKAVLVVNDPESDAEDVGDSWSDNSFPFTFSFHSLSFLLVGLGGGESVSDPVPLPLRLTINFFSPFFSFPLLFFAVLPESSDSKILVNPSPTLGVCANRVVSSVDEGVARVSPVAVRITPFIAEGSVSV